RRSPMPLPQKVSPRTRHYGLFANGNRAESIDRARELLNVPPHVKEADEHKMAADDARVLPCPCPRCGGRMIVIETFEAGRQPLNHPTAPQRITPSDPSSSDFPRLSTAMPSVHLAGQEPAQQTCAPSCLLRLKAPTQSPLSPFVAPSNAAAPHSPASNLPSKLAIRLPRP